MDSPTVAILAAGLGTRMRSKRAKVLHRAGGMTLLEHVVHAAQTITSTENIFAVVGHQAEEVQRTVAPTGIRFVSQHEQKGTGHALLICREQLEGRGGYLVVLYGDCPLLTPSTMERLIQSQNESGAAATVITTVLDDPTGYGRIVRGPAGDVMAIVEQKAATPQQLRIGEINSGIYCFRADLLWSHISEIRPDNPAREYYLTDMVEILRRAGHTVMPLNVEDATEILGINTRVELAQVDRILRERKTRELMLAGVTIEKPETVSIDARVTIGADSVIGPFVQLLGETAIGEECQIGACSMIVNSKLEDQVEVGPFSIVNASRVGRAAHIGPYARLRVDNDVAAGAHIGNFVELKKTRFGAGAKAMHLAYLGDSVIGEKVNVGAGTITCNYDGVAKHQTTIRDGAFIGSNSTLVAPVEIGESAYIGAGSVITSPVPPEALAIGRGRQENKEGWVRRRRPTASAPVRT